MKKQKLEYSDTPEIRHNCHNITRKNINKFYLLSMVTTLALASLKASNRASCSSFKALSSAMKSRFNVKKLSMELNYKFNSSLCNTIHYIIGENELIK